MCTNGMKHRTDVARSAENRTDVGRLARKIFGLEIDAII